MTVTQATSVAYDIPGRGLKWVSKNGSHGNAYAHQNHMQNWKDEAIKAVRLAGRVQRIDPPVHLTAWVHRTSNRRSDAHNVSSTIAACIDGIVACNVIPDDNDRIVEAFTIRRGVNWDHPGISITVEAV